MFASAQQTILEVFPSATVEGAATKKITGEFEVTVTRPDGKS
jgi:hypothetical protein